MPKPSIFKRVRERRSRRDRLEEKVKGGELAPDLPKWQLAWVLFKHRKHIMNIPEKIKSRKLWVAVAAAAIYSLLTGLGIEAETASKIIELAMVYILGQGVVDTAEKFKSNPIAKAVPVTEEGE